MNPLSLSIILDKGYAIWYDYKKEKDYYAMDYIIVAEYDENVPSGVIPMFKIFMKDERMFYMDYFEETIPECIAETLGSMIVENIKELYQELLHYTPKEVIFKDDIN